MNNNIDHDLLLSLYRTMRTIRMFEDVGMEMYSAGKIRGYFHSYIGQEAIAAGACSALRADDYVVSTHRGHGHMIARGADPARMMAELYGKSTGYSGGRGGSMHMADLEHYNLGENGIVAAGLPIATGAALGIKLENSDRAVLCFFGDGASNSGFFAECINMAAVFKLPVIFLLENNCWAATTNIQETSVCEELFKRGEGYGVSSWRIFGNDALEVRDTVLKTIENARKGEGPALIEATTYRMSGHHANDQGLYMPLEKLVEWRSRDPIAGILELMKEKNIDEKFIQDIDSSVERKMIDAVKFAEESPEPDPQKFLSSIEEEL